MGASNFQKWLELATDLAEKTVRNYVGAVEKIESELLSSKKIRSDLDETDDLKVLESLKVEYFSEPENKELDERGNSMYSAAFNKFIAYKGSVGNKKIGNEGIVYIVSNPCIPGLVKIGKTINLEDRLKSLFNSSIPVPFRCVLAKKVNNYSEVEKKLHNGLRSVRENENREFFRIAEDEVISLLDLVEGEDVTPREDQFEDREDQVAFEEATKKVGRFNFELVEISKGSLLNFIRDDSITCTVASQSRVDFEGEDHSLSSAALIATNRMGFNWKSIAGPLNWKYEGELLGDRRDRYLNS